MWCRWWVFPLWLCRLEGLVCALKHATLAYRDAVALWLSCHGTYICLPRMFHARSGFRFLFSRVFFVRCLWLHVRVLQYMQYKLPTRVCMFQWALCARRFFLQSKIQLRYVRQAGAVVHDRIWGTGKLGPRGCSGLINAERENVTASLRKSMTHGRTDVCVLTHPSYVSVLLCIFILVVVGSS